MLLSGPDAGEFIPPAAEEADGGYAEDQGSGKPADEAEEDALLEGAVEEDENVAKDDEEEEENGLDVDADEEADDDEGA